MASFKEKFSSFFAVLVLLLGTIAAVPHKHQVEGIIAGHEAHESFCFSCEVNRSFTPTGLLPFAHFSLVTVDAFNIQPFIELEHVFISSTYYLTRAPPQNLSLT